MKLNVKYGYEKLVYMLKDLCPFYNVPFVGCCMARRSLHSKRGLKLKQGSVLATLIGDRLISVFVCDDLLKKSSIGNTSIETSWRYTCN